MGDSFEESIKKRLDELNNVSCTSFRCKQHKYIIINQIENMILYLNEINRVETRLVDLNSNLENNGTILEIMKSETKDSDNYLSDQTNHFSVESYQLDELNNNKNMIDKNMKLYLNQLKKLFYIILTLTIIYYILISFKPPNQ